MKPVQVLYAGLWVAAGAYAWVSGPWSAPTPHSAPGSLQTAGNTHDAMFHMHRPLHSGGKVMMEGQFHLELASQADGTHRLWVSDAFRRELDPAEFTGRLRIASESGDATEVDFATADDGSSLQAVTPPLSGQVWLSVTGRWGQTADFDQVKFFWDYDPDFDLPLPRGLDSMIPVPSDNQLTAGKIALGHDLFFDPLLSVDNSVSCATCHQPEHGFAEPRAITRGVEDRVGRRNTPSVLNSAYLSSLFWDGRAVSLEEQAVGPIIAHEEMGIANVASLLEKLEEPYGDRIRKEFERPLSLSTIAMAIASYERTLLSGDSDFDRFEDGDQTAISEVAHRGRSLFFGKARCGNCHVPPLFTDLAFHNLGVGWSEEGPSDAGRFEATGKAEHRGAFKTPSLRDVSRTGPYMHDGSLATLRDVVEFYNKGCRPNPGVSRIVGPLNLAEPEIDELVAFLHTLDGRFNADGQQLSRVEPQTGNKLTAFSRDRPRTLPLLASELCGPSPLIGH